MKSIINGRMYNTDTATSVASYNNENVSTALYIKKTGEWFIYGDVVAPTIYSIQCESDIYYGNSDITPITEEAAKEWLEYYDFVEEYIKYFGEPEE